MTRRRRDDDDEMRGATEQRASEQAEAERVLRSAGYDVGPAPRLHRVRTPPVSVHDGPDAHGPMSPRARRALAEEERKAMAGEPHRTHVVDRPWLKPRGGA